MIMLFYSCNVSPDPINQHTLEGKWLGGGYILDEEVYRPFSQFMEVDDSLRVRTMSGAWRDTFQQIEIRNDSIFFPYQSYLQQDVKLTDSVLSLGKHYPLLYQKVDTKQLGLDTSEIKANLVSGSWVSNSEVLDFQSESLMVYDRTTMLKRKMCWDVYDLDGVKLLQKKGSFDNCNYPYQGLSLIHSLNDDSLEVEEWHDGSFEKLTYRKEDIDLSGFRFPTFQLCNLNLYENMNADWYYYKYPSYEGGLYQLKTVFDQQYISVAGSDIEGLVKVQFVINCAGEIGRLEVEEMNAEYEKISLNPDISSQIVEILEGAGSWNPGVRRNQNVDCFKFLIFRIKDGRIDEIFP